mmetsp:Transcript_8069/g.33962  ORF Transcript_8069/g.33962 Transcript_8069/m.33962 type:complete len:639 (+) Transcript_8069:42-1958(+)
MRWNAAPAAAALLLLLVAEALADDSTVVFSAVLPLQGGQEMFVQLQNDSAEAVLLHSTLDRCIHDRALAVADPLSGNFRYRYGVRSNTTSPPPAKPEWESFWRLLEPCRVAWNTGTTVALVHEYYNQSQTVLGLDPLPYLDEGLQDNHVATGASHGREENVRKRRRDRDFSDVWQSADNDGGVRPPPPSFIDDNQVVTLSFSISEDALTEVIWNPDDEGKTYVPANMTYVALTDHQVIEGLEIRRAGGISLHMAPYSYQVKMDEDNNLGGIDTKFKLKAFPKDYEWNGGSSADIMAEKLADDLCTVLGAPVNYMALARLFINGSFQGVYGLLEKVDENFIQRRWPYTPLGNPVGTLYKTQQSNFYLLDDDGWVPERREYFLQLGTGYDVCCPCYDEGCDVEDDCDVTDSGDECYGLECCQCSWQKNGSMDVEEANCATQRPFDDFLPLGDAVVAGNTAEIAANVDVMGYLRSAICELTVMNADGYEYNGKNYYWYRDVNTGKFELITYDQDTSFTVTEFIYGDEQTIWNWTSGLSDALFLPTFFNDAITAKDYAVLMRSYVEQFYRSDGEGPFFQRMAVLSEFIAEFNPERTGLLDKVDSFQQNFIQPMSLKLQEELNIATLPPLAPLVPDTCDAVEL